LTNPAWLDLPGTRVPAGTALRVIETLKPKKEDTARKCILKNCPERGHRAVFNDKLSSYELEKLLAKADIPSLYNRRLQDIAVFMYKIKPQRLCNLFQFHSGSYHLRKREFFSTLILVGDIWKYSFRYLGPKIWNNLTSRIRN